MAYKPKTLAVIEGGTGQVTLTNHGLLIGAGTTAITQLSVASTGTVLTGVTGNNPAFSAAPTLTSVTFGAGTALSTFVQNTFTPTLAFGGASTGITYSTQSGEYTQVGNLVVFSFQIVLTSKGSSTGSATFAAPIADGGTNSSCSSGRYSLITLDALYTNIGASISSSTINLYESGSAQTSAVLADTHFANNSTLFLSGHYYTS